MLAPSDHQPVIPNGERNLINACTFCFSFFCSDVFGIPPIVGMTVALAE